MYFVSNYYVKIIDKYLEFTSKPVESYKFCKSGPTFSSIHLLSSKKSKKVKKKLQRV